MKGNNWANIPREALILHKTVIKYPMYGLNVFKLQSGIDKWYCAQKMEYFKSVSILMPIGVLRKMTPSRCALQLRWVMASLHKLHPEAQTLAKI